MQKIERFTSVPQTEMQPQSGAMMPQSGAMMPQSGVMLPPMMPQSVTQNPSQSAPMMPPMMPQSMLNAPAPTKMCRNVNVATGLDTEDACVCPVASLVQKLDPTSNKFFCQ
jgi:hypothetical protein